VSFQGSGRETSVFKRHAASASSDNGKCWGAIRVVGCTNLEFANLQARGDVGVTWKGSGDAKWWNVDIVGVKEGPACFANQVGWHDIANSADAPPSGQPWPVAEHYFFGTRIRATGSGLVVAMETNGVNDIWFYNGDVFAAGAAGATHAFGVQIGGLFPSTVRFFTSTLRAGVGTQTTSFNSVKAARNINANAKLEMYSGLVRVDASTFTGTAAPTVVGIEATGNAQVHTIETAFTLLPPAGGTAQRLSATGKFKSPYLWPASDSPPPAAVTHGQDLYVETGRGLGDNESHLMVRDNSCGTGANAWRSTVTGDCRWLEP
jgi:hypothetical protein